MSYEKAPHTAPAFVGFTSEARPLLDFKYERPPAPQSFDQQLIDGWDEETRKLVLDQGYHYERNSE